MKNKYIIFSIVCCVLVFASYWYHFYIKLNFKISDDTAVWGQLGDYFGGLLNPVLSFISIVLLIKSLSLQHEANLSLISDSEINKKNEILRSFETHFFNMINAQKQAFDSLKIELEIDGRSVEKSNIDAVIFIEDEIEKIRDNSGNSSQAILDFLTSIDAKDQLYSASRIFYIITKMTTEKLSDESGFSSDDRKTHLITLINFTDYPLIRLIMITIQFLDYHTVDYLRKNIDFNNALNDVGLNYNLY